jgi:uncharacterized protein
LGIAVLVVVAVAVGVSTAVGKLSPGVGWSVAVATGVAAGLTLVWPLLVEPAKLRLGVRGADQTTRARLDRTGGLRRWSITAVDPLTLGVHPAEQRAGAPTLPRYVARDIDGDLDRVLRDGGLVILQGPSASGKTRTAVEALGRLSQVRRLVLLRCYRWVLVPADGARLREGIEAGHGTTRTVVWLDDLERFLGPDGLNAALLDRLCPPSERNRLVLATLRREARLALLPASGASDDAAHRLSREIERVLSRARVIDVERALSVDEHQRAELHRDDPRVAAWLMGSEPVGFAEYLAAAPAILDRWRSAQGDVRGALISAAIDFRRAGYFLPIARRWLIESYATYLDDRVKHRLAAADVDVAVDWTTAPVHGASACLTPAGDDTFTVFDYLVDHVQQHDSAPIPDQVWRILLSHVRAHPTFLLVATAAYFAGRSLDAETALRPLANSNPIAMLNLGLLMRERGELGEAETWWRRAADAGTSEAMFNLGLLLHERGELGEAETWYRRAADAGTGRAMFNLGGLLHERGELGDAEIWWRRAADAGHRQAMFNLGALQRERGELGEAEPSTAALEEHSQE